MSLILDALRKLEREKETRPRGLLVVAPGTWPVGGRSLGMIGGALLAGLVLGAAALGLYTRKASVLEGEVSTRNAPAAAAPEPWPAVPASAGRPPALPSSRAGASAGASGGAASRRPAAAAPDAADPAGRSGSGRAADADAAGSDAATGETAESDPAPGAAEPSAVTPSERPVRPPGPQLQAISEQDGHAVAVIDERVMKEGDIVNGLRVVRIGAAEVEIEVNGRRQVLRF